MVIVSLRVIKLSGRWWLPWRSNCSPNIIIHLSVNLRTDTTGVLVMFCRFCVDIVDAETMSLPGLSDVWTPVAYFYTRHPIRFIP